jgi:hypothetical protein
MLELKRRSGSRSPCSGFQTAWRPFSAWPLPNASSESREPSPSSEKQVLSLDMSYRAYFCEVSENRTGESLSVAALMLKQERSADRAGSGTMGGFLLRRGQTTTFQERLDITERATVGQSDSEIAATLGCFIWMVRKPQSYQM